MPYPQLPRLSLAGLEEVAEFLMEAAQQADKEALRILLKATPEAAPVAKIEAMVAQRLRMLASYLLAKE